MRLFSILTDIFSFVAVLREVLLPQGIKNKEAKYKAFDRYRRIFDNWEQKLDNKSHILVVAGENDYPGLIDAALQSKTYHNISPLDYNYQIVELDGVGIGMVVSFTLIVLFPFLLSLHSFFFFFFFELNPIN